MNWFEVDKEGLGKLLERKGKKFIIYELVQNAWDQDITAVDINLTRVDGKRQAEVTVQDDDPAGFADLAHAYTMFAESQKKTDSRSDRFNQQK